MAVSPDLQGDLDIQPLPDHLPPRGRDGMWGLADIAQAAGVERKTVTVWRNKYLADKRGERKPRAAALPPEDETVGSEVHNWGYPRWRPEKIIEWLRQTGRMDENLRPVKLDSRRGSGGGVTGRKPQTEQDERGRWSSSSDDD